MQVQPLPAASAGLQLVAKTRTALTALAAAMEGREIRKGYVALVSGKLQACIALFGSHHVNGIRVPVAARFRITRASHVLDPKFVSVRVVPCNLDTKKDHW